MIVEYIRYALAAHSTEGLEAAYAEANAHLEAAPECRGHELARCEEAPSTYVPRILWTSTEAHLQGFRR